MYHYTYQLQDKFSNMKYIGKRSCKCLPEEDIHYWGSSKHLPKDVKLTHTKTILKTHTTAKEAIAYEMFLHYLLQVSTNPEYYNKAKQTSIGFDTTGTKLTDEHRAKCSASLKGKNKPEGFGKKVSEGLKGYKKSAEHLQKIADALRNNGTSKGTKNNNFRPWYISTPTCTTFYFTTTKHQKALEDGYHMKQYVSIQRQNKKYGKPIQKGRFKGFVVGELPTNYKEF